jgi:alkaline phosphatase
MIAMHRFPILAAAAAALLASTAISAAQSAFNRIASFPVAANMPAGADAGAETSSEIIAATADGMMLIYSDSPAGGIGLVDIAEPGNPKAAGFIPTGGEPTSVAVAGNLVIAAVNTSKSFVEPSGRLQIIDLAAKTASDSCDLGGQPDSIAVSKDGTLIAVAIENERDEDLNDGVIPQLPAGDVRIFSVSGATVDCASMRTVDLTGIAAVAPDDPEPEFVAFNDANEIAVTLQENNHIAIIDAATGKVSAHFSAGAVDLENADVREEGALTFDARLNAIPREPDAVKWLDNDRLVTANEGDYEGGSRGFTIFSRSGEVLFDSGMAMDHAAARIGHYPEQRSGNKGSEPEGLEVADFGGQLYIFVSLERSSLVAVYRDTGGEPEFVQMLPSGVGPEGSVAIPGRNLFVSANEADLVEDGLARSHVMIYEMAQGAPAYPHVVSQDGEDGRPVGWGALSGLAADPEQPGRLFAVTDSLYGLQPSILEIDVTQKPARILRRILVTRGGAAAQKLDIEGIVRVEGGFWLASEGRSDRLVPHALYFVNDKGEIRQEVAFPAELAAYEKRFGAEGITATGEGDDLTLWVVIQREWGDDPKGQVKLLAYNPNKKEWGAVRYPLDAPSEGAWMGLSEIVADGIFTYVIERDNQIGDAAVTKKIYRFATDLLKPAPLGGELPLVEKEEVLDLIPVLKSTAGYVLDKVEGLAFDGEGNAWIVTDNDGVDDSSGETMLIDLGPIDGTN